MVERGKKALFLGDGDQLIDTFRRIFSYEAVAVLAELDLFTMLCSVADIGVLLPPAGLLYGVRAFGDQAEMAFFLSDGAGKAVAAVKLDLDTGQGKEITVRQLGVRDKNVMVGVGDNGLAVCLVQCLQLLGGELTVTDRGVRVEIGFIRALGVGQ